MIDPDTFPADRHNQFDKACFEDFAVGETFEYGEEKVTAEAIIAFATQFDPEPYHVDEEKAKESIFGGLIASGLYVASLWRKMHQKAFEHVPSEGSPGWDEIRWKTPTRPGDVLRARSCVREARPLKSRPQLGVLKIDHELVNQDDVVRMTFTGIIFYKRRGG